MDKWDPEDEWDWDLEEELDEEFEAWTEAFADFFFLSDNSCLPSEADDYNLGFLEPEDWELLLEQIEDQVDLEAILELAEEIQPFVRLPGLPVQLLEAPLYWLEIALEGHLPPDPKGRKVGSRRLVQLALPVVRLAQELPDTARAAIRTWAEVHRSMRRSDMEEEAAGEIDMPPAVTGFSMMIAMSLILWPERGEGVPVPHGFTQPEVYDVIMARWEMLPDGLVEEAEIAGDAEALFAQGQLAHLLSQLDVPPNGQRADQDPESARAYSRLSRAILWVHNRCRHCLKRAGMTCEMAVNGPQHPVPLLDVATEMANTGRIEGCIHCADAGA